MNAGWTSTVAGQSNDELVVVGVHRVEFAVQRTTHRRDGAGGGVEFEHTAGVGRDEKVRALQVEIAGHGVAGKRPTVLPFNRAVGQESPLEQTASGASKVSGGRRRPCRGPKVGGVGHHRGHLTADKAGEVNDRLPSRRRKGGDFAVAGRATGSADEPLG